MPIGTFTDLKKLGQVRLSRHFFMQDFLHSEISQWYRIPNIPSDPDLAIENGRELCVRLLEPLVETFGPIVVRSGYGSSKLTELEFRRGRNCASNSVDAGGHIWDLEDASGSRGASACIVVPWCIDHIEWVTDWVKLAWFIHDTLPYDHLVFFKTSLAFNIGWRERPARRIFSYLSPQGVLTSPDNPNSLADHSEHYDGIFPPTGGRGLRFPVQSVGFVEAIFDGGEEVSDG